MGAADPIIRQLREHGTEICLRATLTASRDDLARALDRQNRMFARLISILENKHGLRRGHVVSLICAAERIQESVPVA